MTLNLLFGAMICAVLCLLLAPLLRAPASTAGELDDRRSRLLGVGLIAFVLPLGAGLLYSQLGSPQLRGEPYAQRQDVKEAIAVADSAAQIAATLKTSPDANGYARLAQLLFSLHRYAEAADACRQSLEFDGNDAGMWAELGESLTLAHGGAIEAEALAAFSRAYAMQPRDPQAEFYLGVAKAQSGQLREAVAIWRDLENRAPVDAPWLGMVKENIDAYAKKGGFAPDAVAAKPPVTDTSFIKGTDQ